MFQNSIICDSMSQNQFLCRFYNNYYLNGTGLTEDDTCIGLPNLQESYDFVMELLNCTEE